MGLVFNECIFPGQRADLVWRFLIYCWCAGLKRFRRSLSYFNYLFNESAFPIRALEKDKIHSRRQFHDADVLIALVFALSFKCSTRKVDELDIEVSKVVNFIGYQKIISNNARRYPNKFICC